MDVGCRAAGCDAEDDVFSCQVLCDEIAFASTGVVFGAFLGFEDGRYTAGDDALDELGVGAEGGWDLTGVEHAESAGGAGADVKKPAAEAEAFSDDFHSRGDGRTDFADGVGRLQVLLVHELNLILNGEAVEELRGGVGKLGEEVGPVLHGGLKHLSAETSPVA